GPEVRDEGSPGQDRRAGGLANHPLPPQPRSEDRHSSVTPARRSVTSPSRIVRARSSLSGPADVRTDVGVTPGLPPREPGVSERSPATDVPDVVRNPQPD